MPKKRNKKKQLVKKRNKPAKKKKAKNRSKDANVCAACGKKLSKEEALQCVCTRVVFCNDDCKRTAITSGVHKCTGAPGTKYKGPPDLFKNVKCPDLSNVTGHDNSQRRAQMIERVKRKLKISRNPTFSELKRVADNGSAEAAFLLGIRYAGRIQYTGESWLEFDENNIANPKGCLETDALAAKYFMKAAKGGCPPAMLFLSMKLSEGTGIQTNRIKAADWAWKAFIHGESGAKFFLNTQCMVFRDLIGTMKMMQNIIATREDFVRHNGMCSRGPNLATLLLSRWEKNGLIKNNFKFPPICGEGAGDLDVVGAGMMRDILRLLRRKGLMHQFYYYYGRFGSIPSATGLSAENSKRAVDNESLQLAITPKLVSEGMMTVEGIDKSFGVWAEAMYRSTRIDPSLACICPHMLQPDGTVKLPGWIVCPECVRTAKQRLETAFNGTYAIENNPAYTNASVVYEYRGKRYHEEFKFHNRPEIRTVLACLAADHDPPILAHPCFIAQDPNLIWPSLLFYGSIRAALEHVAPGVDWVGEPIWHLGPSQPGTPKPPLVEGTEPGEVVYRCGSDICCKLFRDKRSMRVCGRCRRRSYCSPECHNADWIIHKRECVKVPSASSVSYISSV